MATPPTVVKLDLYDLCEKRVGPKSFLTDLPDALALVEFVQNYYIPFGVGTFVDVKYADKWYIGEIIFDDGNRNYKINFNDGARVLTLNLDTDMTALDPFAKGGIQYWRFSKMPNQEDVDKLNEANTAANEELTKATAAVKAALKEGQNIAANNTANVKAAVTKNASDAEVKAVREAGFAEFKKANLKADAANAKWAKATADASAANAELTKATAAASTALKNLKKLKDKSPIQFAESLDEFGLNSILTIFKSNKYIIFYGLFRILMACDAIHDFLGGRGFNNCKDFNGAATSAGDIKLAFRNGIVDAVIDSFKTLFIIPTVLALFNGIGSSATGSSSDPVPTPPTAETLANALLHVCLRIIELNNLNTNQKPNQKITLDRKISLKQNLMDNLTSDADAKKLSNIIIDAIGVRKVSGNIQRNDYKTGFPTIVDTHEAIDSYYNPNIPQYWKGDIECRVDAIKDRNHFIPVIIGLWNTANITTANGLKNLDPNNMIENAIQTWINNFAYNNIDKVRDVYSTFRKINIERDASTNFDASFVDSLTKTSSCLTSGSNCDEYKNITFEIKCGVVPILFCSLTPESESTFEGRKTFAKEVLNVATVALNEAVKKNQTKAVKDDLKIAKINAANEIPKKRKITLNVTNYFGAIPSGASSSASASSPAGVNFYNIDGNNQLLGVNKIAIQICANQTNIVQQSWSKTLGDFLQIMTYLHIGKEKAPPLPPSAKMFITLDIIASNIACLFDKFVFLEDPANKKYEILPTVGADADEALANAEDEAAKDEEMVKMVAALTAATGAKNKDEAGEVMIASAIALFERTYGGTYIYIPKKMTPEPAKTTKVNIMSQDQLKWYLSPATSSFGSRNKSNFGKKIKAAISQARAYLKKNQFGKKTINLLPVNELRTKLNSVGIKTYVLKSGKKVNLSLRQLQSAANYFKKLQISCKNAGIKLMYNRNGKYYYKSYSRLVNESRKIGKSGKSNKINAMDVNELRTRLNSVGIKTYVLKSGKKVNLPLIQLQRAANYFKKLQIRCKNAGIKLMYKRNGKYYYKSYTRLMSETKRNKFG